MKAAERDNDGYNTSQRYTKLAQAWYHSSGSLPVEDGTHSTDQPGGKEQGQGKLATWSSKLIPEKRVSTARLSILILSKT